MASFSRHASLDKISQLGAPRQSNGAMQGQPQHSISLQQQQLHQACLPGSKSFSSFSSHTHQTSSTHNGSQVLLNTELRAQARREREATREKSKDMLLSGQTGRERSSSILSNHQLGPEKKISPKGMTKTTSAPLPRLTAPRHAHKTSTGAGSELNSQKPSNRQPLQPAHAPLDRRSNEEIFTQRQPFSDLANCIPSPPDNDESTDVDTMQTAYFVKYYYDIMEKCHSWQRYASNLKAKAETLELENRILKDINEGQDREIRMLKGELCSVKQANMLHEHERRRSASLAGSDRAAKDDVSATHLTLPGYNDEAANTSGKSGSRAASSDDGEGRTMMRGGSALSEAATVTGDYLQEIADQRRRLRKVSQSQQQQLHLLQARPHLPSNASQCSIHSLTSAGGGGGGGSRPSSRLSNYGGMRARARSRAGSYTVHDSIPVEKDDVFGSSDALPTAPIKRAGTMPLASLDVNIHSNHSSRSSMVDEWIAREVTVSKEEPESPQEASLISDSDPKGAHRRLYIRLRDELETADLVRFERYVHRYDALEIGVDGSRGIINRVRRLLLPEELVEAKLTLPEKYKLRKELAREFERIVREDALPKEGESQEVTTHFDMLRHDENYI